MLSDCFKQLKVTPFGIHYPIISLGFDAVIWSENPQGSILCCNHIPVTTISLRKNSLKLAYHNHLYQSQPSLHLPVEFNVFQIFWPVCFFFLPIRFAMFLNCSGELELSYSKTRATANCHFPSSLNSLRLSLNLVYNLHLVVQNHASNHHCSPNLSLFMQNMITTWWK